MDAAVPDVPDQHPRVDAGLDVERVLEQIADYGAGGVVLALILVIFTLLRFRVGRRTEDIA